ncbi:MAG: DUF4126 domain-containing protein [Longimicrobiales bacterium]
MGLAAAILTAVGLAACAGLRAFMPLFGLGVAARVANFPLAESMDWMASDIALIIFGVATAVEIVADKVPVVDHALDAAQTVIGPAAGIVAGLGVFGNLPAPFAIALAIVAGGAVAGTVHAAAASTRIKSTAITAGTANPFLSVVEDFVAFTSMLVALAVPLLVLVVLVAFILWVKKWRARRARIVTTTSA